MQTKPSSHSSRASVAGPESLQRTGITKLEKQQKRLFFFHGESLFGSAVLFMGTVGRFLASLARPEPVSGSGSVRLLSNEGTAAIFNLPSGDLSFLLGKCVFYHFFPHRDERLRQHGVAAASSSPGRTDDSAILGQLRNRSAPR